MKSIPIDSSVQLMVSACAMSRRTYMSVEPQLRIVAQYILNRIDSPMILKLNYFFTTETR